MSPRKTDTRERAMETAFELFSEKGYEQTSLREIAERLGITKAALYYHFPSKEALLQAITAVVMQPMDEMIAWSRSQPRNAETRRELLQRIAALVQGPMSRWVRFAQENQPALREHPEVAESVQPRMLALFAAMIDPDADLHAQAGMLLAPLAVYLGNLSTVMPGGLAQKLGINGSDEELAAAMMDVALELVEGE